MIELRDPQTAFLGRVTLRKHQRVRIALEAAKPLALKGMEMRLLPLVQELTSHTIDATTSLYSRAAR